MWLQLAKTGAGDARGDGAPHSSAIRKRIPSEALSNCFFVTYSVIFFCNKLKSWELKKGSFS
jgi:hypothetical protein